MHVPVPRWYNFTRGDVSLSYPTENTETHDARPVYLKRKYLGGAVLDAETKAFAEEDVQEVC